MRLTKVCIIGASGKLGRYMVQHALGRGYEVVAVCRERSVGKLEAFRERITIIPGATNDREVIQRAVAGCDAVLTVLVPWGVQQYSSGTAQAVLDYARPGALNRDTLERPLTLLLAEAEETAGGERFERFRALETCAQKLASHPLVDEYVRTLRELEAV